MQALDLAGITCNFGIPGLTNGTTTTYTIGAAFIHAIRGKINSKGTGSNVATPTTDGNTGAAFVAVPAGSSSACYGCVFVWCVNLSDTVTVYQGTITETTIAADGANTSFKVNPSFPNIPADVCPFAYTIVRVGSSGAAFTMGGTSLASGSNIYVAHQDIAALPDRLQP